MGGLPFSQKPPALTAGGFFQDYPVNKRKTLSNRLN
jgi:hypothetical protein